MNVPVVCVLDAKAQLGEGPVWDAADHVLYWIDILSSAIHCFDPVTGSDRVWTVPAPIGSLGLAGSGTAVLALQTGFHAFNLATGRTISIGHPEAHLPGNRFNDGKVDRNGRFWAGTLSATTPEVEPVGSLYRLDADLHWSRRETGIICSNGIGWSPDDRIMYFTDSRLYRIYAYEFELGSGGIANRRVFHQFDPGRGFPDGLTVDSEGHVWTAMWDGGRVVRLSPEGKTVCEISIPARRPTSCTFGGSNLEVLYVTSALSGVDVIERAVSRYAGGIFAVRPGIRGIEESRFRSDFLGLFS